MSPLGQFCRGKSVKFNDCFTGAIDLTHGRLKRNGVTVETVASQLGVTGTLASAILIRMEKQRLVALIPNSLTSYKVRFTGTMSIKVNLKLTSCSRSRESNTNRKRHFARYVEAEGISIKLIRVLSLQLPNNRQRGPFKRYGRPRTKFAPCRFIRVLENLAVKRTRVKPK